MKFWNPTFYKTHSTNLYESVMMLRNKETKKILQSLGSQGDIQSWIDRFHAKPYNYKSNTYYRVVRKGHQAYSGVGNGLYLGRDKQALINFYDIDDDGFPVHTYRGKPKWLNLLRYSKYRDFENYLKTRGIDMVNSENVGDVVIDMGYDGIRYYDPMATGEEFVLFNLDALRRVG